MVEPKPAYHHGDLPNALLDAVERLIVERGVHGVSLRAAARLVGVSHAAPAHHFGDLQGLLQAVSARGHTRFGTALRRARDGAGETSWRARMERTGRAYMDFAAVNPGVFEIMFRADLTDAVDEPFVAGEESFGVLTGQIAEVVPGQDTDGPDVRRLALVTWSTVHGATLLWLQGAPQSMAPDMDLDAMFAMVAVGIFNALAADPACDVA